MKFAFSTVSCPAWDFEQVASRAKEYGYDGVEVRAFANGAVLTAANVFLTDPAKLQRLFADAGVELCCIASSVAMTQEKRKDRAVADELRTHVDIAQAVGCPTVKIFDTQVKPGRSRAVTGVMFGDWLLPLADYAAQAGVCIAVENALSFRNAKELWAIVDRMNHPSVGVAWDLFNAAMAGEPPSYSVPTLNSKIVYTQLKDAKLGPLGATYVKLGEGDCKVRDFLRRLRGVGYEGYVTLEWEKAWLPNLAEPEEILPDAITKLREWATAHEISDWEHDAAAKAPPKKAAAATATATG
jgi:sugar phosphate isomerase/epimerase